MAEHCLASSPSGAIPPAPSFASFRFSTIGQDPLLLKRMQSPDLRDNGSPCPSSPKSGELKYPSTVESQQRSLSRPTLFQSLTPSGVPNTRLASQPADVRKTRSTEQPLLPHLRIPAPSQRTLTCSSAAPAPSSAVAQGTPSSSYKEQTSISVSPLEAAKTSVIYTAPTTKRQMPLPATVHHTHTRALHARLMTSLSKLHPPDMTDALFRAESAKSHSVNALTTAHRSHILAQQSMATAQEAVAATQECFSTAEQARTYANDAFTAIRQLQWQWQVNHIQLQDELCMLGELLEKENGGTCRDAHPQSTLTENKTAAGAVKCPIGVSCVDRSSEVSHQVGVIQSREPSLVIPHPGFPSNHNLDHRKSLELEAGTATRSLEQSHLSSGLLPAISETVPMEVEVDLTEHLPPEADGRMLQEALQPAQSNEVPPLSTRSQVEVLAHISEAEPHLQIQCEKETRSHKSHDKPEVVMMQRRCITSEDLSESAVNASELESQKNSTVSKNIDKLQPPQSINAIIEDANHAFEKIEQKRQSRCLLQERKQRELAELKKKEEELTAAKEQELIAEQEKRRQEVMLQKQRATAETAARINAERARERERAMGASLLPPTSSFPTSSTPQSSLPDRTADFENLVTKRITTSWKSKSLSDGVKLGSTTDEHTQPTPTATSGSLPPSPVLAGSVALALRSSKAGTSVNTGPEDVQAANNNSRKAALSTEKFSPNSAARTPTPINDMNGIEDLHVYRHSNDPGNLCVVPRSRVPPTSPEAQAVNLRFVKDGNGVRWDASTLFDPKPEFEHRDQSSIHRNSPVSVKKESPIPAPLVGLQMRRPIEPELIKGADSSLNCSLPVQSDPSASLPPMRGHRTTDKDVSMSQRGVTGTTKAVPASTTHALSYTINTSVAPPFNTPRPHSNVTPPNPHRDNLSSPRIDSKPLTSKPVNALLTTPLATLDMSAIDPILPDDATHIAPVIHANGGWDRPGDEEVYSGESKIRELTPPQRPRQLRRGGGHYSPPPRAPTPNSYTSRGYTPRSTSPAARSPRSPVQRSPVLGKRRQREDVREDEYPPRRQWPTDGTRRTRSPPPHLRQTQRRSTTPHRPALQARMQVINHSHVRLPSTRELAWRSPSPDRPALQARIGVRDSVFHAINGGQSYRPTYSSDTYERPQSRTRDNYQSRPADQSIPVEPRGYSYNRGRGNMNGNRASPRGRGNRGGNRLLNLEQRISSSTKPLTLTLMNRLESPPRN
ncbi:hypothetical protein C0989_010636 [Termitomyces sp. Mn162]|nr:hypothetical protein C0989_010636 [Termitomyces sp. Mn162]